MSGQAEWTILVYLNAKNNLEEYAFPNFAQMASVGSTPEVKIVVEMGRPKQHYCDQFGAWSKTLRFAIGKGTEPTEAAAIEDLGAVNMGDAQSLVDFVTWGRERYPARRTMLVIWNHGQGWRAPAAKGEPPRPAAAPPSGHRYVSTDDDTGDKLYNRAIQDGLTRALAGQRLDVVAFDACLMSMVETAYALRGVARVMVGSEEVEPGNGWNYTRWLQPLVDERGAVEPAELGRMLVRGMKDEYGDDDDTTLSAIDLDRIGELAKAISAFATSATPLLKTRHAAFRDARRKCKNYAPGSGLSSIDLGHFMLQVEQVMGRPVPALAQRAADVRMRIAAAVIENYASARRQGAYGSTGLAIYYPISGAAYARDPDREGYDLANQNYPVEFVHNEMWSRFLHAYWTLER